MKVLHFGAGNIGRGFIAPILFKDKQIEKIVFADVNQKVIDEINQYQKYEVIEKGEVVNKVLIENIAAINSNAILENNSGINLEDFSIITISIGQNNLKYILPHILKIVEKRINPLVIMCCENGNLVSSYFKNMVEEKTTFNNINFVDCVVDRIVPNIKKENLDVEVETYYSWVVNEKQWPAKFSKVSSLTYTNNISGEINKKICLLNGTHAALGWHRWQIDKFKVPFVKEALSEAVTSNFIKSYLNELSVIISKQYGFEIAYLNKYSEDILMRFLNPYLSDELERVCRNPIQKLQINERIMSPTIFAIANNLKWDYLKSTINNALNYNNPNDLEGIKLQELSQTNSQEQLIGSVITDLKPEIIKKLV